MRRAVMAMLLYEVDDTGTYRRGHRDSSQLPEETRLDRPAIQTSPPARRTMRAPWPGRGHRDQVTMGSWRSMAMASDEAGPRSFIERYVRELMAAKAIRSPEVERAFRAVERHRLLETFYMRAAGGRGLSAVHHDPASPRREQLELIYCDDALVTRF